MKKPGKPRPGGIRGMVYAALLKLKPGETITATELCLQANCTLDQLRGATSSVTRYVESQGASLKWEPGYRIEGDLTELRIGALSARNRRKLLAEAAQELPAKEQDTLIRDFLSKREAQ